MSGITIKTKEDIEKLRRGGKVLAHILDELEKEVVPGNTTLDVDDKAMQLIEKYGATPLTLGYHPSFAPRPYPASTCVSIDDVVVHGIPNEYPETFMEGDVVSIDLVIEYEGMVVDSARTVGAGTLAKEDAELLEVTRQALKAGIAAVRPGAHVSDIGKAVEAATPKGFSQVRDFCGHGVGYSLHEEPQIPNYYIPGRSPELKEGMVLAIEPMVIIGKNPEVFIADDGYTVLTASGQNAAHMEHTVLVTKKGVEVLTVS